MEEEVSEQTRKDCRIAAPISSQYPSDCHSIQHAINPVYHQTNLRNGKVAIREFHVIPDFQIEVNTFPSLKSTPGQRSSWFRWIYVQ